MTVWLYALVLVQLIIVSWIDIKTKKISNYWFLINLVLAIALYIVLPEAYPWQWTALLFPGGWLVVGFLLFTLGVMGAGDSKYLASLFLLIPLKYQTPVLEKIIYTTIVVGLSFLGFKLAKDFQRIKAYAFSTYWRGLLLSIRSSFSYAPVVLMAWLLWGMELWK